jgi:hypothetical protein
MHDICEGRHIEGGQCVASYKGISTEQRAAFKKGSPLHKLKVFILKMDAVYSPINFKYPTQILFVV